MELLENGDALGKDCVDAVWLEQTAQRRVMNFSSMMKSYKNEISRTAITTIPTSKSLTVSPEAKLRVNMEGCVNTLSDECVDFYAVYGRDGRNGTAPATYPCFFDPEHPDLAVTQFDRDRTYYILLFFVVVPVVTFFSTLFYICLCNKLVRVADDGRMRLRVCGKYVSGIGQVKTKLELDKMS